MKKIIIFLIRLFGLIIVLFLLCVILLYTINLTEDIYPYTTWLKIPSYVNVSDVALFPTDYYLKCKSIITAWSAGTNNTKSQVMAFYSNKYATHEKSGNLEHPRWDLTRPWMSDLNIYIYKDLGFLDNNSDQSTLVLSTTAYVCWRSQ